MFSIPCLAPLLVCSASLGPDFLNNCFSGRFAQWYIVARLEGRSEGEARVFLPLSLIALGSISSNGCTFHCSYSFWKSLFFMVPASTTQAPSCALMRPLPPFMPLAQESVNSFFSKDWVVNTLGLWVPTVANLWIASWSPFQSSSSVYLGPSLYYFKKLNHLS